MGFACWLNLYWRNDMTYMQPYFATLDDHLALLRSKFRIEYHNNFWFVKRGELGFAASNDRHFILRELRKYQVEEAVLYNLYHFEA